MAISDPSGGLLLQVETARDIKPTPNQRLNLSDAQLKGIGDILSFVLDGVASLPTPRAAGGQATGPLYRMVVPPHLQEALRKGTATVGQNGNGLRSAVRDGASGHFIGEVNFQKIEGVASSASGFAGILPAAGVVAATAIILVKLEKIDRKLSGISEQVATVTAFQEDKANSELIGGLRSLLRCQDMLTSAISDADFQAVQRRLQEIFDVGEQQHLHRLQSLKSLTDNTPAFDSPALRGVLEKAVPHVQSLTLAAVVMARTAAVATLLPSGTPFTRGLEKSRDKAFGELLEAFQTIHGLTKSPERRMTLSQPRRVPRLLQGLHHVVTSLSYRIETVRQKQECCR